MKIASTILVFVCLQFSSNAQNVLLNIPDSANRITSFIPKNYSILDSVSGDLNKDGVNDIVLALKHNNEDRFEMDQEPKRVLLILFKSKKGLKVAGKSENVLMCGHCGGMLGDPFASLDITKGVLSISHYGGSAWRWGETRKFRYQKNAFYLIGLTSDYFWIASDCDEEGVGNAGKKYRDVNFVTGNEEIIERGEDCKLIKHLKQKTKKKSLVKLEDFKFNWK